MAAVASRIPASLQAVFMASNRGEEVHIAPTDKSACRVYSGKKDKVAASKPVFARIGGTMSFKRITSVPPQAKFHLKLKAAGYSPRNFASKRSAYYNKPTEHQRASYGSAIIQVVKNNRVEELRRMLEAGLSANACNEHGESLLHMACRHGRTDLFKVLIAFDADIAVTDDYGRTPMHDACWASAPSFEIAEWLMKRDPNLLFLFDARGSLPLSYVTKALWGDWNEFLEDTMDTIFPRDRANKDETPPFCNEKPDSRPVPDPKKKIPASMARMIANGEITPCQAVLKLQEYDDDASTMLSSAYDSDEDDDSSYYSDSDFDSDEEEELFEIVGHIGGVKLGMSAIAE